MNLEVARHQWEDGLRAVERERAHGAAFDRLSAQVEVISAELARRVGQTFTLEQLAAAYADVDRWALSAIQDALPDDVPPSVSTAADAAFLLYSRRASDYRP